MRPDHAAITTKTAHLYAFRIVPSYQTLVRRWRIAARCNGSLSVAINGGTAVEDPTPGEFADFDGLTLPRGITVEEVLGSQTATESDGAVSVTTDGTNLELDSIECFELPRAFIAADSNEYGVELAPFRGSQPIRANAFENLYAGAMNEDVGRRVLFQWAVPYSVAGAPSTTYAASTSSATFSDVFGVAKPCLARKKFNDGDYTQCTARIFAWVSGGGSGEFRVSSQDGTSSVVTITNTSPAWSSELTGVQILCEDLSTADGIPGDGWDDVQIQFRATSGILYVASAYLGE